MAGRPMGDQKREERPRETMHQRLFTTISQARLELFQWLTYYNGRRRHSSLGYLSPVEFEQQHQTERRLTLAA
ncbi:transposase [Streptomyces sp. S1A1-7]|nr:transposase [Streptomyces sp. S1A1-7]